MFASESELILRFVELKKNSPGGETAHDSESVCLSCDRRNTKSPIQRISPHKKQIPPASKIKAVSVTICGGGGMKRIFRTIEYSANR
jgi:hypothetical protein